MPKFRYTFLPDYESRAALGAVILIACGLALVTTLIQDEWRIAAAALTPSLVISATIIYAVARLERAVYELGDDMRRQGPPFGGSDFDQAPGL